MNNYRESTKSQSLQSIAVSETETLNAKLIKKSTKRKPTKLVFPSITNIGALFMKNWITMKRNILLLLFVFFLPAIVLIVNSVAIGQDPKNLPMAIVNLESDCSDRFFLTSCEANLLGCYFQEALNQSKIVTLVPYTNVSEAYRDTELGLLHGAIVVPPRFSVSYLKKILDSWRYSEFLYYFSQDDEGVGKNETISISLDESDTLLELFMKKAITDALDEVVVTVSDICEDHLADGGIDLKMTHTTAPLLGFDDTDFKEFVTPGMICGSLFFLAMALTSESFITERSQGLLERSWVTGVLPIELIVSYIMSQFLVMAMQVEIDFMVTINSILTGILFSI